jgi:hypothetical protein
MTQHRTIVDATVVLISDELATLQDPLDLDFFYPNITEAQLNALFAFMRGYYAIDFDPRRAR